MRILFTTTAGRGHLHPLVPIARAARRRGHEVEVAAPASLGDRLAELALPHRIVPERSPELEAETGRVFATAEQLDTWEGNELVIREFFGRISTAGSLPTLVETLETWRPDLVVHEALEFAGALAAESAGVPHAAVAMSTHAVLRRFAASVGAGLSDLRRELGLPGDQAADAVFTRSPYLTVVPTTVEGETDLLPDTTIRYRGDDLHDVPPVVTAERERPLLWATFGTEAGRMHGMLDRVVHPLAEVADGLDADVLLTTGHPYDAPPLPDNVRIERYVPQEQAFAQATAVWCHGGFNTTFGAVASGRPQLISPLFAGDTWFNAERIEAAGAAIALYDLAPSALASGLRQVLADDGLATGAQQLAAEVAGHPSADDAYDQLLTTVGATASA